MPFLKYSVRGDAILRGTEYHVTGQFRQIQVYVRQGPPSAFLNRSKVQNSMLTSTVKSTGRVYVLV